MVFVLKVLHWILGKTDILKLSMKGKSHLNAPNVSITLSIKCLQKNLSKQFMIKNLKSVIDERKSLFKHKWKWIHSKILWMGLHAKQMPSIVQAGPSRLSIDQALLKYFPMITMFQDGLITFEEFLRVLENANMEKICMKFTI